MNALAHFESRYTTAEATAKEPKADVRPPMPGPWAKPARPMTGFLALLSPEQRAAALAAYDGPQDHGDEAFLRPQPVD